MNETVVWDFFWRQGHGPYIWGAIGMCALVLAGEIGQLRWRRRHLARRLRLEATAAVPPVRRPTVTLREPGA